MHINKTLPLVMALAGSVSPALAQEKIGEGYMGFSVGAIDVDVDGTSGATPTTAIAHFGNNLTDYLGFEFRIGTGITDEDISANGTTGDVSLNSLYGAYGVGRIPLADGFSLYGLAGFTHGEVKFLGAGGTAEESEGDTSYGIGARVSPTDRFSVFIEYAQYLDGTSYDVSGGSIGGIYQY